MTYQGRPDVNTKLWLGVAVVTALLCQPAGIAAIVFVALAMKAQNIGDHNDAAAKLKTAKLWAIVGIVVGIPASALYLFLLVHSMSA